jgi:hypothetical protein
MGVRMSALGRIAALARNETQTKLTQCTTHDDIVFVYRIVSRHDGI